MEENVLAFNAVQVDLYKKMRSSKGLVTGLEAERRAEKTTLGKILGLGPRVTTINLTETPESELEFQEFVKKPIPIQAVQVHEPFVVDTLEGQHKGNAGDYLIIGIRGERYPCRQDIFEESYKRVK